MTSTACSPGPVPATGTGPPPRPGQGLGVIWCGIWCGVLVCFGGISGIGVPWCGGIGVPGPSGEEPLGPGTPGPAGPHHWARCTKHTGGLRRPYAKTRKTTKKPLNPLKKGLPRRFAPLNRTLFHEKCRFRHFFTKCTGNHGRKVLNQ